MKIIGKLACLLVIGFTFMQAGASLFAISVNVSTLIEAPPASLATAYGPYAFNPDVFWERFPTYVLLSLLLALIFNWKSSLRKWILAGGLVWVLSGVVVFVLLSPAQTEFLSAEFSNTVDQELIDLGNTWKKYSLLFMSLSALSGVIYVAGLLATNK